MKGGHGGGHRLKDLLCLVPCRKIMEGLIRREGKAGDWGEEWKPEIVEEDEKKRINSDCLHERLEAGEERSSEE